MTDKTGIIVDGVELRVPPSCTYFRFSHETWLFEFKDTCTNLSRPFKSEATIIGIVAAHYWHKRRLFRPEEVSKAMDYQCIVQAESWLEWGSA